MTIERCAEQLASLRVDCYPISLLFGIDIHNRLGIAFVLRIQGQHSRVGGLIGSVLLADTLPVNPPAASFQDENGNVDPPRNTVNQALKVNHPPVAVCRNIHRVTHHGCTKANLTPNQVDNGSVDVDGQIAEMVLVPPPPYPIGATQVLLWVVDNDGASNSCSATVTIIDGAPPSISCPPTMVVTTAHDQTTSNVAFPDPSASDECSPIISLSCAPPSGSNFEVGKHSVTCFAVDGGNNTNDCSFQVVA